MKIQISCLSNSGLVFASRLKFKCGAPRLLGRRGLAHLHLLLQGQSGVHSLPHHVDILGHPELHAASRQRARPRPGGTQPLRGRRGAVPFRPVKLDCWPGRIKTLVNVSTRPNNNKNTRWNLTGRHAAMLKHVAQEPSLDVWNGRALTASQIIIVSAIPCFTTPPAPAEAVISLFPASGWGIFLSLQQAALQIT